MKQWNLTNEIKEQLKLLWFTALHQIFGYYLSPRQKHILAERAKMTRKLWLSVMWNANWRCQIRSPYCTFRAQEVDHIKPLFLFGYTEEKNLQASCRACNKYKGVRIL